MTDVPEPATVADLMKASGLGRDTVRQAIKDGQLPGRKIGRKFVIPRGEFNAFVEGRWTPKPMPAKPKKQPDAQGDKEPIDFLQSTKRTA